MPPLPKSCDEITLDGDWVNTSSYIYACTYTSLNYLDYHILGILGHGSKCLDIMGLDILGLDILGIICSYLHTLYMVADRAL